MKRTTSCKVWMAAQIRGCSVDVHRACLRSSEEPPTTRLAQSPAALAGEAVPAASATRCNAPSALATGCKAPSASAAGCNVPAASAAAFALASPLAASCRGAAAATVACAALSALAAACKEPLLPAVSKAAEGRRDRIAGSGRGSCCM